MTDSSTFAPKVNSGINLVDQVWGGLFKGGRYLAYGTNASGRNLLTLAFAAAGTKSLETSLLVSRLRQQDLAIQSASINYDLPEAVRSGILRISRTPFELELIDRDDDSLESSLKALASLIIDSSADRVLVDDFSPFTRFSSFERFRTSFARLLTEIEHSPSTLVLGIPEPANDASRRIVDYISTLMTGCFHVHLMCVDGFSQRTISLVPQIGHQTQRVDLYWSLEATLIAPSRSSDTPIPYGEATAEAVASDASDRPSDLESQEPTSDSTRSVIEEQVIGDRELVEKEDVAETGEHASFEFSVEPAVEFGASEEMVFLDRDRFTEELQLYFDDYESSSTPFNLVAMRSEQSRDDSSADDFNAILGALQNVLGREDSLFADPVVERIIVILGDDEGDGAQQLFARLRAHLRGSLPDDADRLLNVVAAVVVPNGQPFATSEEFVRYVLDDGR